MQRNGRAQCCEFPSGGVSPAPTLFCSQCYDLAQAVELLLSSGAKVVADSGGITPIHLAAAVGSARLLQTVLKVGFLPSLCSLTAC